MHRHAVRENSSSGSGALRGTQQQHQEILGPSVDAERSKFRERTFPLSSTSRNNAAFHSAFFRTISPPPSPLRLPGRRRNAPASFNFARTVPTRWPRGGASPRKKPPLARGALALIQKRKRTSTFGNGARYPTKSTIKYTPHRVFNTVLSLSFRLDSRFSFFPPFPLVSELSSSITMVYTTIIEKTTPTYALNVLSLSRNAVRPGSLRAVRYNTFTRYRCVFVCVCVSEGFSLCVCVCVCVCVCTGV